MALSLSPCLALSWAIHKSASTADPAGVLERRRLGAANPPNIVLTLAGANHTFQNGAWNAPTPDIVVFDDAFVSANVCSGIEVEAGHRQTKPAAEAPSAQLELFAPSHPVLDDLRETIVDGLTPLEALNLIAALKARLERK